MQPRTDFQEKMQPRIDDPEKEKEQTSSGQRGAAAQIQVHLRQKPANAGHNRLLAMNYLSLPPAGIFEAHCEWAEAFARQGPAGLACSSLRTFHSEYVFCGGSV